MMSDDFIGPVIKTSAHQRHKAFMARIERAAADLQHRKIEAELKIQREALEREQARREKVALVRAECALGGPIIDTITLVSSSLVIVSKTRRIQDLVCEKLGIERADMLSSRRKRASVMARQIAMFLVAENTSMSYPEMGQRFGGRDHTTVLHAVRRVEKTIGSAPGTSISHQWCIQDCDFVRLRVAELRKIIRAWD